MGFCPVVDLSKAVKLFRSAGLDFISGRVSVESMKSVPAFLSARFSSVVQESKSGPKRREETFRRVLHDLLRDDRDCTNERGSRQEDSSSSGGSELHGKGVKYWHANNRGRPQKVSETKS